MILMTKKHIAKYKYSKYDFRWDIETFETGKLLCTGYIFWDSSYHWKHTITFTLRNEVAKINIKSDGWLKYHIN